MVAAEEAVTIGAWTRPMTSHAARWRSWMTAQLDAAELRCRAILSSATTSIGTLSGTSPPSRAQLSEAGWLAVEHGWPRLAVRAARLPIAR